MQTRKVFNLVSGKTIESDWVYTTREEHEEILIDKFLPSFDDMVYCSKGYFATEVCGHMRIINANTVTDSYIEERDETKF